jgi:hypothetical protein
LKPRPETASVFVNARLRMIGTCQPAVPESVRPTRSAARLSSLELLPRPSLGTNHRSQPVQLLPGTGIAKQPAQPKAFDSSRE